MKYISNKTFQQIKVGDTANISRKLTHKDILLFSILSGDINPAHLDADYAKNDFFHKVVGHGMWLAALISTVLGTKLPGPGTIYLGQTLKFKRPVAIGDKITVKLTVSKKFHRKPVVLLTCICVNQYDKVVLKGLAKVLAPTEKVKLKQVKLPKVIMRN